MSHTIFLSSCSDTGLVRKNNEDFWSHLPEENFFVIADGMGGHRAGEVASKSSVEHLCLYFKENFSKSNKSLHDSYSVIEQGIMDANQKIYEMGLLNEAYRGMGTTLCCIHLHEKEFVYAHVGDSRIYCLRRNKLEQLTNDHSLRSELIASGRIHDIYEEGLSYRNVITRAIGTEPYVEPSIDVESLCDVDGFLMCTDGLTDLVDDEEIEDILLNESIQNVADYLVKLAKKNGGHDNITVIFVKLNYGV